MFLEFSKIPSQNEECKVSRTCKEYQSFKYVIRRTKNYLGKAKKYRSPKTYSDLLESFKKITEHTKTSKNIQEDLEKTLLKIFQNYQQIIILEVPRSA